MQDVFNFHHRPLHECSLAFRALSAGAGCILGVCTTSLPPLILALLLARRISRQIWVDLVAAATSNACVQCVALTGACAASSHCWAGSWELLDLDHSHAATPQLCVPSTLHVLSCRLLCSVLGTACRVTVCMRRACYFYLRMSSSAASVELLLRGHWRAVAFPRWLHVLSWLDLARCYSLLLIRRLVCCLWRCCCIRRAASSVNCWGLRLCLCYRATRYSCCATLKGSGYHHIL